MRTGPLQACPRSVRGFTLIEVLIALVVLSVGILGVLALQMNALAYSHSAYLASIASVQAMDLEERMRANRAALDTYVETDPEDIDDTETATDCQGGEADCSALALATYDMHRWVANTRRLFAGTVDISLESVGDGVYQLTLQWTERSQLEETTDDPRSLRYLFRLSTA
ncbi:pilus modification protein PilV [Salinisphaera orenii MK-B5]|uniref:Pilus modification protein PilV n=1 Tax=Salinisphaera orenii MK-B5 TaxID=856730 RepID=A0A423PXK9_9GAMM|nr:type IV pilus modification protein PilV [Salinisphaera orenii]ROO30349.1 pilus modification protein PilV [Salinisphaera orenii MK-B5]